MSFLRRLREKGDFLRSSRFIMLRGWMIAAAIGIVAALMIWQGRQTALQDQQRAMDGMGLALAEQTSRYAQVMDIILKEVQFRIDAASVPTPAEFRNRFGRKEIQRYLNERLTSVPQADAIDLIDADGLVLNWSREQPLQEVDVRDRDYYLYFKDHNDPNLFIGAVSRSRAGANNATLFYARRLNRPDGGFLGVVLGLVDVRHLNDFYQSAGGYVKQMVTLLRPDGTVLLRGPGSETAIGVRIPSSSPWHARAAEGGGSYVTAGAINGAPVLVTVHPLRDYPLVVDLSMDLADVFAKWRTDAMQIAALALAAAVASLALFWMLARRFRQQAEQNAHLELGRQRFDVLLNNITQGVCFFDGDERLLLWNRRYLEIYNLTPETARVGRSLKEIVAARFAAGSGSVMSQSEYLGWRAEVAASHHPSATIVTLANHRSVAIMHQPMPDGGWVATHEDITERQQAEASIQFMARHDALTKLPNRALFQERMEQAIALAGRGTRFAVICLDLDNFKQVNDTLGHPVGDSLLIAVANRLLACAREEDTVARLGGDEFAIIQLGMKQVDDAEVFASRILAAFRQPFDVAGHQIMAGTSIGVTLASADIVSYETLMRDADIALYLAKTEGRGTVRFFEPEMDARIHARRMLEKDLQGAIAGGEFELYYQPQINLITNRVCGFEALLRWHHPERGMVSPLEFIPVAEETGMIVQIGEWVVRAACEEARRWPDNVIVAVNLSPIQFRKCDIVATVRAALDQSGLRPERLELEITESVFLGATAETMTALHRLREMGVSVALDDFGTGYSSLSYLHSFPFNKIKIDQSFVRNIITNKESMSIVRAVVGLGRSLEIVTVAEGVETPDQLEKLRATGCTEAQGYYFSRPAPASQVLVLIERLQAATIAAN